MSNGPYRHFHVIMRGNTNDIERELDRLSEAGWEVVDFAVVHVGADDYEYIYLMRKPA